MLARAMVSVSGAIMLTLGLIHIAYTFWTPKLTPRDPALQKSMSEISPILTRQTTMWKAWVGFNVSHSLGAILFGLIYGYLALAHPGLLFGSGFLIAVGFALLLSYSMLAKVYWFSAPFTGVTVALACYAVGVAAGLLSPS